MGKHNRSILHNMGATLGYTPVELALNFGIEEGQSIWIFDFLQILKDAYGDTDYYFWKLDNNGNKHLQLRFYK